jgi:asparagine synthase (glutamine-hydrolysing)
MLAGDGGDELFGGNARYATQYLYSLYSDLPRPLREMGIDPIVSMLPSLGIAGKVKRYIAHASVPMPARYDNYNLLERLGPENVFSKDFLGSVDRRLPAHQVEGSYHSAQAGSLINRMLALDLKYTLADDDLPKVVRSCELAGVGVRFPLLDDDLVAFAARLPPTLKLCRTQLRYFFKRALNSYLPQEIIRKTKHGFGLPVGPWLQSHPGLRAMALDSLAVLKKRSIVRPQFIDELTDSHVKHHANYYGTMVWVLMMFEQWVRQHKATI